MSSVVISGDTSGAITLSAPAVSGTTTLTLPATTGTVLNDATVGVCRAWARFTGSTAVISASYNVSSITRSSAGNYLVNFTTALSDTNYAVAGAGDNASTYYLLTSKISANTTSSAGLQLINAATAAGDGTVSVAIFR